MFLLFSVEDRSERPEPYPTTEAGQGFTRGYRGQPCSSRYVTGLFIWPFAPIIHYIDIHLEL